MAKAQLADSGQLKKSDKTPDKLLSRAPTMLPIEEANSERDKAPPNRTPNQSAAPPPIKSSALSPTVNTQKQSPLPSNPARHSVDFGNMRNVNKEVYRDSKKRQSLTDLEHEKGYWETKNSSASSGAERHPVKTEDNLSRPTSAQKMKEVTSSRTKFEFPHQSRERFVSVSKETFQAAEMDQEGPLTARKRKQSLLSPTDQNANVQFVEEQTSELLHLSRAQKSSRNLYKEPEASKSKLIVSNSREVLKANRIDLML